MDAVIVIGRNKEWDLFLVVPNGKLSYTNKILKQHSINANVLKIK